MAPVLEPVGRKLWAILPPGLLDPGGTGSDAIESELERLEALTAVEFFATVAPTWRDKYVLLAPRPSAPAPRYGAYLH